MSMFRSALVAVLLCGLLPSAACFKAEEKTVRIGIHVWPGYDTLILARDKGYLADTEVKLIELPSATESIRAFQNKTVDGALLTLDEVLRLADHGHDPVIILVMDFSNGADAVLGKPGVDTLASLKGKTIGLEPNALGAYLLARALDSAGLDAGDVSTLSMPITETETAFVEGQVDAVVTYEPHLTRILDSGATRLFDSSDIPGEITDVLVVRRKVLDESPNALQELVNAQFRALDLLAQSPAQALPVLARRENVTEDEVQALLGQLVLPDRAANQRLLGDVDQTLPTTLRLLTTVMQEHKMLGDDQDADDFRDDRFVQGSTK